MNSFIESERPLMSTQERAREVSIRLEDVSVRYRVPRDRISTFKEYAIRMLQRRVNHDEFWALRDVSLEVQEGEVFGIIGRNGAGKSTVLKVIARVLRPTTGRAWIKGRVAPLLECGAGFHPELTGRENTFLNGTLLGFSRKEMEEKFEQIVEFAELWDFIDAPLRTYSSGMAARLGFAIATDVKSDILIVDEVLAVGDESFHRKSTARMQEFRDQGATILLVSHNMKTVEAMCKRTMWIDRGMVKADGTTSEVVSAYLGR
jgi:ABC-2 type transport system ATP-binding protein/lipopolysaccharide transport system ATP-binding protein